MANITYFILLFLQAVSILASPTTINAPIARLPYGTFIGVYDSIYNLTYYRKIPFSAPPTGNNRFRRPQPPLALRNGTYGTNQSFDMCPQRTTNGSEDCLYLGVYSRPFDFSSSQQARKNLRPVLLTFYGGGFIQGSASFTVPPSGFPVLNASILNDYVVVYSNYRTNVLGFLAGSKVAAHPTADLNVGLLDQRVVLEWIQEHIHAFGGDKKDVTIWGQSAGGGSVVAHVIAEGNWAKGLFKRAMSSSPYWPKTYAHDSPENEALFKKVVEGVGCQGSKDEVKCLKGVEVQKLRDVSLKLTTEKQYTTSTFTWGPVIDTDFLSQPLSYAVRKGRLNVKNVFSSYNLHEGENFVPPGLESAPGSGGFNASTASFDAWLRGYLPGLSKRDLRRVEDLYRAQGKAEEIMWNSTYTRAGMIYRDVQLACPAYWLADTANSGWLVEYTISPAKHASDTIYWNQLNPVQQSDPLTYKAYAGAMASFVQTGDPNSHKITNSSVFSVPALKGGKQFVIRSGGVASANVSSLKRRCAFWLSVAQKIPI